MRKAYLEYVTIKGDTWDSIALDFYNDEKLASKIIEANPLYRKSIVLNDGITLKIPLLDQEAAQSLPPWKRGV